MKGEQKQQVAQAVKQLGGSLSKDQGKDVEKLSRDAMWSQLLPKNVMGLSDSMVEGLYSQAYRLYNTGKYKDAMQMFRLLIMIDSTEAKFAMGLAACLHMIKEYQGAISAYSLCGIIDPESPIPHYHASDCYIQMKDYISAIISLEMAVKRAGDKPEYQALKDRALMTIESLQEEAKMTEIPKNLQEILDPSKKEKKKKKK